MRETDPNKMSNTEWERWAEARIAELVAQKTRSQEHYIKLLGKAEAENQRLRDALESIDESTHDVHAARKARKALLGGGENG